jgi:hypothetical protein
VTRGAQVSEKKEATLWASVWTAPLLFTTGMMPCAHAAREEEARYV